MSNREFIHDIVLQVAIIIAFFAIMGAITSWNCARCDAALAGDKVKVQGEGEQRNLTTSTVGLRASTSPKTLEAAR